MQDREKQLRKYRNLQGETITIEPTTSSSAIDMVIADDKDKSVVTNESKQQAESFVVKTITNQAASAACAIL